MRNNFMDWKIYQFCCIIRELWHYGQYTTGCWIWQPGFQPWLESLRHLESLCQVIGQDTTITVLSSSRARVSNSFDQQCCEVAFCNDHKYSVVHSFSSKHQEERKGRKEGGRNQGRKEEKKKWMEEGGGDINEYLQRQLLLTIVAYLVFHRKCRKICHYFCINSHYFCIIDTQSPCPHPF